MGFLDAIRSWGSGQSTGQPGRPSTDRPRATHPEGDLDESRTGTTDPSTRDAVTPYDREQWRKKLKRILASLPASQGEWKDLSQEAGALELGKSWVERTFREEFSLLVRAIVSDRVVTWEEHLNLDLARTLMGIPDAEAEAILASIVVEAETFFGTKVAGA